MEEQFFQISFIKVMELVLNEERQKIRKFIKEKLGDTTADFMDVYPITESEVLKLLKKE